jgi:hypothetical protein
MEYSFDGLLEKAKKKKMIKTIPDAPKLKIDLIKQTFKNNKEITEVLEMYEIFRLIDGLNKTKEGEFRKGVCLKVTYKWKEISINLEKLKEYSEILERFINYTKLFLLSKN